MAAATLGAGRVIGSGIAGISTAYELCKLGMSVMVIDRGPIAGGMTSRTSAHLAPLCDDLVQRTRGGHYMDIHPE